MLIKIRKGLDLPIAGVPEPVIRGGNAVTSVALMGDDYLDLRPTMHVEEGSRVRLGEPLFSDKRNPGVRFTAPGCGEVVAINRGARRALQSVVIRLDGAQEETFNRYEEAELDTLNADQVEANLIASGLWTALRTRPMSKVPAPGSRPAAIFVTAIDSHPLAGAPEAVVSERREDFVNGVRVLARLTEGWVFVCTRPDSAIPVPEYERIKPGAFSGPHPAGLPGTHIHFLYPASPQRVVWHLGYQDVLAIGRLFTTGRLDVERVAALGGPTVKNPRMVRTRLGANTEELMAGELLPGKARIVSGSVLSGRRAAGWARFLRRYHVQVCALPEGSPREFLSWIKPGFGKYSAIPAYAGSMLRGRRRVFTTSQNGSPRAMVPIGNFEPVMPLDILPAPLLRALIVRDTDTAQALGCLELDEEDLALCSFVCPSKYDYGDALRATLTRIEKEG